MGCAGDGVLLTAPDTLRDSRGTFSAELGRVYGTDGDGEIAWYSGTAAFPWTENLV